MMLKLQKRLAADVAGCSEKRIMFDPAKLEDIKEAITKTDIRLLIGDGTITVLPKRGVSRARANIIRNKKRRGMKRGAGSRKGRATARTPGKRAWINKIRVQREFLKEIKDKVIIPQETYKDLYRKAGGGFFRSIKHIKIFMNERNLAQKTTTAQSALNKEYDIKQKADAKKQSVQTSAGKAKKLNKFKSSEDDL
jgi:large subunit ribosomal protein L19e